MRRRRVGICLCGRIVVCVVIAAALLCNSSCSNRSSTPIQLELIWQTRTATVMPWIAFDKTGSRLAYGGGYYKKGVVRPQINILNTESLATESLVKGQDECFCFLPNGSLLFSDSSGRAWIYDLSSSMSKRLHGPANVFTRYAVSQDGKYLATVVNRSSLQIWHLQEEKGDLLSTIPLSKTESEQLDPNPPVFSPAGDLIAYHDSEVAEGKTVPCVRLWEPTFRRRRATLHGAIGGLAFSPDGKTVAAPHSNGSIRFWSARTGRMLNKRISFNGLCVAYSPDGKLVAVGGSDSSTRFRLARLFERTEQSRALGGDLVIADAASGENLWSGRVTRDSPVYAVAFSPDGKYVAVSTKWAKARVMLWRIRRPGDRASPVGTSF